ncbi:LacI family transcriptional regulator [Flavobacteriaceae bacterium F89]|uniref:LacI family transcriptional regulator n=1 Tax=Cerina litoralis TaxID=2874477 RepID=A0AAE3JR21_9FLAO|nr:LacI family DNA-binding transcriptional regulator [Cerina litoralis]MCG2462751.1 LacI family transcriptional regulator [Cerina litoralis]
MKKQITLKDIAKELDVSISTVSKALKNSDEIGHDTKEKIQAFAKLYNYRPNNIAISLKNKRTRNIGVIIPNIVHYFFATVVRGIENFANAHGYNVIVCVSDESFDKEVINMEMLANGSIDGFIMSLSSETQLKNDYNHIREVMDQGIPLVFFDRATDEIDCDKVIINDREAAYQAVNKFVNSGRKRIALITSENFLNVSDERAKGYFQALREHGIEIAENLVLKLPYIDIDEKVVQKFFSQNKIDAVLCVNEVFAVQCMRFVQKTGIKVPEDISFIGFTDGLLSKYATPSLTAINQHGEDMGEMAAKMLVEKIESEADEDTYRIEILKATLVERESTVN